MGNHRLLIEDFLFDLTHTQQYDHQFVVLKVFNKQVLLSNGGFIRIRVKYLEAR